MSTAIVKPEAVTEYALSGKLPSNPNQIRADRAAAKSYVRALNQAAHKEGREIKPEELKEYNDALSFSHAATEALERFAGYSGTTIPGMPGNQRSRQPRPRQDPEQTFSDHWVGEMPNANDLFGSTAEFINSGEGGAQASLSEGGGLQFVVPGWEVAQFIAAYPLNSPFEQAGATIIETPDAHQLNIPIVTMGTAPSDFAENTGPSSASDAGVYVAKLNADKKAFLTKFSEEAGQDIGNLQGALIAEGVRRVARAVSDKATDALVASLAAASASVDLGTDNLNALLNLEAAIDPTWASPTNVFMMDRSSLARFRNTRDLNDKPIFDPTSKMLLSYRVVINDRCRGKVLFGAFQPGVYIRKTPLIVLRLLELYSESGQIGIRFQQRSDQAFFADAATAAQAPQPLYMLDVDVGS